MGMPIAQLSEVDRETRLRRSFDTQNISYDPVTLRTRPYWWGMDMPFAIFTRSCIRRGAFDVANDEVYNEYVKVVCHMLDAGVSVVDQPPPHERECLADE
jgi:hypothetical protein